MEFLICFGEDEDKLINKVKKKPKPLASTEYDEPIDNGAKKKGTIKLNSKGLAHKKDQNLVKLISKVKLDTENVKILEYKNFEEEIDYGNIEYKLKLNSINEGRMDKLATQMQFRIMEGGGECFYEIGVEDNGNPIGLTKDDLEESLKVLYLITEKIDAKMTILNYRDGQNGLIGEILIRKEEKMKSKIEIKIGLIGEEQSGKSTLVGVLVTDNLDNGLGLASKNVFRHKHEVICGKTSSFTHQVQNKNLNFRLLDLMKMAK